MLSVLIRIPRRGDSMSTHNIQFHDKIKDFPKYLFS